jgi:hypothetical protein
MRKYTDEHITFAIGNKLRGLTSTQNAKLFEEAFDMPMTKNAIIGLLNRNDAPILKKKEKPYTPIFSTSSDVFTNIRNNQCRYINGDMRICQEDIVKGSYCQIHYDLCHRHTPKISVKDMQERGCWVD